MARRRSKRTDNAAGGAQGAGQAGQRSRNQRTARQISAAQQRATQQRIDAQQQARTGRAPVRSGSSRGSASGGRRSMNLPEIYAPSDAQTQARGTSGARGAQGSQAQGAPAPGAQSRSARRAAAPSGSRADAGAGSRRGGAASSSRAGQSTGSFTASRGGRSQQRDVQVPRGSRAGQRGAQASRASQSQQGARSRRAGQGREQAGSQQEPQMSSRSVDELRRADRRAKGEKRAKRTMRRRFALIVVAIVAVVGIVAGGVVLYNSPAFSIEEIDVNGVEHLTSEEVSMLASVPPDSTLLRVDADGIVSRLKQSAWVEDAHIDRVFPGTLVINVTERQVAAIVEIPTSSTKAAKSWAIASDYVWLMPIPEANSEAAKSTSSQIYEDEKTALHIVDLPFDTQAEIGQVCIDANVNNALDILAGMTTELADRVVEISAASTAETTLILDDGVEIAFGKAEDIRDKERVVLQILEENPDNVSYINVRMVETPTWRAI